MPLSSNSERVFGMYVRSSLRMSSARMKTKLGLAVIACASRNVVPDPPDKSTTDNAAEINNRTVLLIPIHPYLVARRKKGVSRPACCSILIVAEGSNGFEVRNRSFEYRASETTWRDPPQRERTLRLLPAHSRCNPL